MEPQTVYPTYSLVEAKPEGVNIHVTVLTEAEAAAVPESHRERFAKDGLTTVHKDLNECHFISNKKLSKFTISADTYVQFSEGVAALDDYHGVASDLLACHKFSRKQKKSTPPHVHIHKDTKDWEKIRILVEGKNKTKELGNGRGDNEGTPAFFEKLARSFAEKHSLEITVFKGDELLDNGFRLMHAVGRASDNAPTFVNLKYNGNKDSDDWVAFVGKGVCFDTGGLNIKTSIILN